MEGREAGIQEGREVGIQEGREVERNERDEEWLSWLGRREEALAAGEAFDEPPPSARAFRNGN